MKQVFFYAFTPEPGAEPTKKWHSGKTHRPGTVEKFPSKEARTEYLSRHPQARAMTSKQLVDIGQAHALPKRAFDSAKNMDELIRILIRTPPDEPLVCALRPPPKE